MRTVIDLFSGIGGFALGLESTGYFKTVQFVENEKWCQKILNKNFPEIPIHDDVKTFKGYDADVVVGGFPCQPFSVAGKQQAIQDNRHLWPDMFRVIKETKPTWIIGENVRNIVSISEGMVLEQVYLDLESEGYEVQSFIIPASAVNAPHQRYRTWIVAHTESFGSDGRENSKRKQQLSNSNVANTDSKGSQRQRKITIRTYEELENFGNPCWWNTEPNVGRVASRIPNRVDRLKGLGNAIVPQIAYQIGKAIMEAENDNR
tara:strand:- start:2901 stop:3683 length:783 start_codon:yes stop_codon:yes gene_type:complete